MPNRPPTHHPHGTRAEHRRRYDQQRGTSTQRGYDARWRRARLAYLREHPLCIACEREGRITPATIVDHIIPHRGDYELFWRQSNWAAMCKPCHDAKTGKGA
jgi:5-methylcytosine-specific restriction protein A